MAMIFLLDVTASIEDSCCPLIFFFSLVLCCLLIESSSLSFALQISYVLPVACGLSLLLSLHAMPVVPHNNSKTTKQTKNVQVNTCTHSSSKTQRHFLLLLFAFLRRTKYKNAFSLSFAHSLSSFLFSFLLIVSGSHAKLSKINFIRIQLIVQNAKSVHLHFSQFSHKYAICLTASSPSPSSSFFLFLTLQSTEMVAHNLDFSHSNTTNTWFK